MMCLGAVINSEAHYHDTCPSPQVNSDPTAIQELRFLRSILDPFLEAYWVTTTALMQLPDSCMDGTFKYFPPPASDTA